MISQFQRAGLVSFFSRLDFDCIVMEIHRNSGINFRLLNCVLYFVRFGGIKAKQCCGAIRKGVWKMHVRKRLGCVRFWVSSIRWRVQCLHTGHRYNRTVRRDRCQINHLVQFSIKTVEIIHTRFIWLLFVCFFLLNIFKWIFRFVWFSLLFFSFHVEKFNWIDDRCLWLAF